MNYFDMKHLSYGCLLLEKRFHRVSTMFTFGVILTKDGSVSKTDSFGILHYRIFCILKYKAYYYKDEPHSHTICFKYFKLHLNYKAVDYQN